MARANSPAGLLSKLTQFGMMVDSTAGLSTTIASTAGSTATTITLGSSGASTGTYIRIGDHGDLAIGKVESISTAPTNITLVSQLGLARTSTGACVVELVRSDLGDVSDDGVSFDTPTDRTRIDAATLQRFYAYNVNHVDGTVTVGLENVSFENLLAAKGIDDSDTHGAGSVADPTVADWNFENMATVVPLSFWAQGAYKDGTTFEVQFWDCDLDPSGALALTRGQDAPVPFTFNPRFMRWIKPLS